MAELERCQKLGIKIIILVEHGGSIKSLEDVIWWNNPRCWKRVKGADGHWKTERVEYVRHVKKKNGQEYDMKFHPTTGYELYKKLMTMQKKYDVEFQFCDKRQTGTRILEILGGK